MGKLPRLQKLHGVPPCGRVRKRSIGVDNGKLNLMGRAPLVNIALCLTAMDRAVNRKPHLPGIITFTGPSGFGKSSAAAVTANRFDAVCVQADETWTRKGLLTAILEEMGVTPGGTLYTLGKQVAAQLALSRRPLIIDECDCLVKKDIMGIILGIYEGSNAAIMLIGEENLPTKLRQWERLHGRVLDFVLAQPASLEDARALRDLYVDGVDITDDLLAYVHKEAKGSVRRICVNLERIREEAVDNGLAVMDREAWGDRPLFTGEAPARRL